MSRSAVVLRGASLGVCVLLTAVVVGLPGHTASGLDVAGAPDRRWQAPLSPAVILRGFAAPASAWAPGHRGVDLAARPGQVVYAPADGVIAFAGIVAGKPVISISHGADLRTTYEPVTAVIAAGQSVARGTVIGHVAAGDEGGGHCAGRCVHWGARLAGTYVDPLRLLRRIVLKPMRRREALNSPGPASRAAAAAPRRCATATPCSHSRREPRRSVPW